MLTVHFRVPALMDLLEIHTNKDANNQVIVSQISIALIQQHASIILAEIYVLYLIHAVVMLNAKCLITYLFANVLDKLLVIPK